MPTFYNFRENGVDYSFDDIFVPADMFRDGTLFTWGSDIGNGRLGNATVSITASTPVTTFAGGSNWKQVSIGLDINSRHSAAIKTDGTLWSWGSAASGRLGNAVVLSSTISTPVTTFAGETNWKQVSVGYNYTAAIKTDGTLWTWGNGTVGQLGNATTSDNISTPVTTFAGGTNWKQVSAGSRFSAAIKTDGTLWVWGQGSNGKLGNNDTTNTSTPITTFAGGNNWKQVSSGGENAAAIKTDGTLWLWGSIGNGRLGNGVTTGIISTPITTFAGGTNWKQVSCGTDHTAAIKTDGTLWSWGSGGSGRLGNAAISNRSTPVTTFTGGTNWKQVDGGSTFLTAIKTDGTLWTWGLGSSGQLGNATTTNTMSTPITTFAGGNNWKQVDGGGSWTAAVTYDDPVL
jgi:alpha-tubulin suppressor-like RCC1 family protein